MTCASFRRWPLRQGLLLLAVVAIAIGQFSPAAHALTQDQINAIASGAYYFNTDESSCGNVSSAVSSAPSVAAGSSIYILGDSITVRAEANYNTAFSTKGLHPFIDASVGRSWDGAGQSGAGKTSNGNYLPGSQALTNDSAAVRAAGGIVIALGSNGGLSGNPIQDVIAKVRTINASAPIWWVNITGTNAWKSADLASYMGSFNKALGAVDSSKLQLINWETAVAPGSDPTTTPGGSAAQADPQGLLADGLHPNQKGVPVLTNLVVSALTGGGASAAGSGTAYGSASQTASLPKSIDQITQTASTDTNATDVNARITYQYLVGKGLTPNQAAGIMGNITGEAHFRADDGSEHYRSSGWPTGGYGIVQWTGGRRTAIVNAMNAAGIGDLYNQQWDQYPDAGHTPPDKAGILLGFELDYMWYELNHDYKSSTLDPLKNTVNYQDATTVVYKYYESPGPNDHTLPDRITAAFKYLKRFSGLGGLIGGGSVACSSTGSSAGVNGWDLTGPHAMITYGQYDPKYANGWYGGTIAICGCGPTSMAMAIASLTGDTSVTPIVVADYYGHNGGLAGNCGSNWAWSILSRKWPSIKTTDIGTDLTKATATIKAGGFVLVSYHGQPFTGPSGDHLFLIRAVTDDGRYLIANPLDHFAGKSFANQNTTVWDASYFSTQVNNKGGYLKNMWAVTKQ